MPTPRQIPQLTADEIEKAIKKMGFTESRNSRTGGAHVTFQSDTTPKKYLTLSTGKHMVPRPTIKALLEQGAIDLGDFLYALGGRHRKAEKQRRKANPNAPASKDQQGTKA